MTIRTPERPNNIAPSPSGKLSNISGARNHAHSTEIGIVPNASQTKAAGKLHKAQLMPASVRIGLDRS
jgi:hypothetical protein